MKAVVVRAHGGLEALEVVDRPEPEPEGDEVVVDVTHVGLNHLDVWVRRGVEGHDFGLPLVACSDIVGRRADTGEPVALTPSVSCMRCPACLRGRHDLCRDHHIRGEGIDGGLCERVAVPPWQLLPLEELAPASAAALPLALLTAWHMVVGRAGVGPGDTVLVQAGAGGVASLAIQVARMAGARVVATASTEAKRALCVELGAEAAWSYEELRPELKRWAPGGVDVVVEHVGAATWSSSVRAARWGGTVVTCGATAGHEVPLNLRVLFFKQLSLLGSTMGSLGELHTAWGAATAGEIRPVVDRVLPVREVKRAHELLESRKVAGKVVLAVEGGW